MFWSAWLLATFAVAQPRGQPVQLSDAPVRFRVLETRRSCQLAIPKLKRLCQSKRFAPGSAMEIALQDFDSDGREDVAVRFRSIAECISLGCPTQLYHAQRGGFVLMSRNLLSDGPAARCRSRSISGVAFPTSGDKPACWMFPGWTDRDVDPPNAVFFEGSWFGLLQGSALRIALAGHSMQSTPCNDSSQCIQRFYESGEYGQSEDRFDIAGKYVLRRDRYCAAWEDHQFCAAVYQSEDGRLARTDLKCGTPCLTLVQRRRLP